MTPNRKRGAPLGNKNALKHALYARHYSAETKGVLRNWDVKDYISEIHLLRVGLDKLTEILISKDVRRRRGEIYLALDYATSGFFSPWRPPRLFVPLFG